MNVLNWARRRLFNTRAAEQAKILAAPRPAYTPRNRAERRDSVDRKAVRRWKASIQELRAEPKRDYPVLAHCIHGACKRLPRYRGMCYTHRLEAYHGR